MTAPPGSIESLYPFLYQGTTAASGLLDQVRQSTIAKTAEILSLPSRARAAPSPIHPRATKTRYRFNLSPGRR